MTLPLGYRSRAAARDDVDALVELFRAADLADVGFDDPARDEIYETWAQPWFDLETRLARRRGTRRDDRRLFGDRGEGRHDQRVRVREGPSGSPRPRRRDVRGRGRRGTRGRADPRRGHGAVAQRLPVDRRSGDRALRGHAATRTSGPSGTWSDRSTDLVTPAPDPEGITIRPGAVGEDERISWALLDEAFSEHFGYEPLTFDEWLAMWSGFPGYDPVGVPRVRGR